MAIIYTYPTVTPSLTDKVLISGEDNKTQNATLTSIKDVLDVVDSLIAGPGISVSSPTGNVTISNTGVLSLSNSFGTYISGTSNSSSTGDVSIGTIDLSATGTPSTTNFLRGDNTWNSISLTTDVTGILPIANGGTNASTANDAINNLLPDQSGQSGNFLQTNGTTTSWVQAAGGGTITGGGTLTQLAYFDGNSSIASNQNLRIATLNGNLISGNFDQDAAGRIIIENEEGTQGGNLRIYGQESSLATARYIGLNASQDASAIAYEIYFPKSAASGAGKVLKSAGASGELEWGEDTGITGNLLANQFPVATGQSTVSNSIMSQQVATSNPTHHRIRITSPAGSPALGQFPSIQLYNGSNGDWNNGDKLSEIQTYSNDQSSTNPHVCSFINTVQGSDGTKNATDGELVFGTAPYGENVGAQESLRINKDGSVLVTQSGTSADPTYRAGTIKLQGKGAVQFYESGSFDDDNFKISSSFPAIGDPEFKIGDTSAFNGYIGLYSNGAARARIYSTGLEIVPSGTVDDPSISFNRATVGTNAGFFYQEITNKIAIASEGTELFTVEGTSGAEVITSKKGHQFDENINITGYVSSDLDVGASGDGYDINVAEGNVRLLSGTLSNDIKIVTSTNNVATFDGSDGNVQQINLTENVTIQWSGMKAGAIYTIVVYRGSSQAARTITWNNSTFWPNDDADPGQTNEADKIDIYQLLAAGSTLMYGMVGYLDIPAGTS